MRLSVCVQHATCWIQIRIERANERTKRGPDECVTLYSPCAFIFFCISASLLCARHQSLSHLCSIFDLFMRFKSITWGDLCTHHSYAWLISRPPPSPPPHGVPFGIEVESLLACPCTYICYSFSPVRLSPVLYILHGRLRAEKKTCMGQELRHGSIANVMVWHTRVVPNHFVT